MATDPVVIPEAYVAPTITVAQRQATHVGSRYEGSVSITTGRRDGVGKYFYPNSFFTYEGEWVDGKKHGRGRMDFGDAGGFYEGDFDQGEIRGQGSQCWPDGTVYTGQFADGERNGQGTIDRSDGSCYNGAWQWNKYGGQGELMLPNGDCYIGEFKSHKYHGKGVLTQPQADRRYEGLFEAGLFEGDGELKERGGAFVYVGQFKANSMSGQGKGTDPASAISYSGAWTDNAPVGCSASWDVAALSTAEENANESYLTKSELLREEAVDQANGAAADPKAKAKAAPKAAPKKGEVVEEEPPVLGPELEVLAGQPFPEVVLRLVDAEKNAFLGESGRRWKVTMYRERQAPKEGEPSEMEVVRREIRFGDERTVYRDPLDPEVPAGKEAAKGGKAPSPPPPAEDDEAAPEPYTGEASMDGAIGDNGELIIGGIPAWGVPVHLQPMIYWLRVEDTTEDVSPESFCQMLPPLEFPFRITVPE